MKKRVGAAVIAVLSVGGLLLGSGPAQASSKDISWTSTTAGWDAGRAMFESLGDNLVVCDEKNGDGYGVYAELRDESDNMLEYVYDGVPDGVCRQTQQNLYEEVKVYFWVCLSRNGVLSYCRVSNYGTT